MANKLLSSFPLTIFRHPRVKGILARLSLAAIAAQTIWALNISGVKYTVGQLDPYLTGVFRLLFAGLILLILLYRTEGSIGVKRHHLPLIIFSSVIGMGVNTVLWQLGLSHSSATNASLIVNVSPVIALLVAVMLGQEKLEGRRVLGMLVALSGVILIINPISLDLSSETLLGNLLILGAASTWAIFNVVSVRLLIHYSPLRVTTYAMGIGALFMIVFSPIGVKSWDMSQVDLLAWLGIAFSVVFAAIIAQTIWAKTIQQIGASATMVYAYINPLLVVVFAAILLSERLSAIQAFGAVFILIGLTLTIRKRRIRL